MGNDKVGRYSRNLAGSQVVSPMVWSCFDVDLFCLLVIENADERCFVVGGLGYGTPDDTRQLVTDTRMTDCTPFYKM